MQNFDCDAKWPICLYDFTFKDKKPTQLVYRVADDITKFSFDGYFYGGLESLQPDQSKF